MPLSPCSQIEEVLGGAEREIIGSAWDLGNRSHPSSGSNRIHLSGAQKRDFRQRKVVECSVGGNERKEMEEEDA